MSTILGLKPQYHLYDFLIKQIKIEECLVPAGKNIDVLCSDRKTTEAEDVITGQTLREITFEKLFGDYERGYDAVLIDVAPSITLFQTCAMVYTRQVLIPVAMETLSVQGASASIQAAESLNSFFKRDPAIRTIGILPVMVDRRMQMTDAVMSALEDMSAKKGVALLPHIRTDQTVVRAARNRKFLADFDPKSKALEDYTKAVDELLAVLGRQQADVRQAQGA
jgi:chromosome partitioning protein